MCVCVVSFLLSWPFGDADLVMPSYVDDVLDASATEIPQELEEKLKEEK